jgi:hypothetical protein
MKVNFLNASLLSSWYSIEIFLYRFLYNVFVISRHIDGRSTLPTFNCRLLLVGSTTNSRRMFESVEGDKLPLDSISLIIWRNIARP